MVLGWAEAQLVNKECFLVTWVLFYLIPFIVLTNYFLSLTNLIFIFVLFCVTMMMLDAIGAITGILSLFHYICKMFVID